MLNAQLLQMKTQQNPLKPPTLGSQLNSAESHVKKATQRKLKLESQLHDTQKQLAKNEEELKLATQTLEEVKAQLKREKQDNAPAVTRPASQEPAVAEVATGVCKEFAQSLSTLQLGNGSNCVGPGEYAPTSPKDRSRSTSRSQPKRAKGNTQTDGMKAAINRICVLGQHVEHCSVDG
eukprot:443103-Amphidinium_carterae.1